MSYVIGAVLLVVVLFAFLQNGSQGLRRPRRVNVDIINDTLNKAEGARISGKLDDAEYHYSRALNFARDSNIPVHCAESYYGLARVQEDRKLYREAHHMIDLAIRAIEPVRADFENYYSLLTRYKQELSAKIK